MDNFDKIKEELEAAVLACAKRVQSAALIIRGEENHLGRDAEALYHATNALSLIYREGFFERK